MDTTTTTTGKLDFYPNMMNSFNALNWRYMSKQAKIAAVLYACSVLVTLVAGSVVIGRGTPISDGTAKNTYVSAPMTTWAVFILWMIFYAIFAIIAVIVTNEISTQWWSLAYLMPLGALVCIPIPFLMM